MTITVEFSSKDRLLAQYYQQQFGEKFTKQAQYWPQLTEMEREGVQAAWDLEMFQEARFQEHYDYTVDEKGRRTPIEEREGVKKLLIPEVTVKQL